MHYESTLGGSVEDSGIDIHLHRPADVTRKNGPNAGVATVCILLFFFSFLPAVLFWVFVDCAGFRSEFCLDLCIRVSPNGSLRAHQHRDGEHESHKFWNYGSSFPTFGSH